MGPHQTTHLCVFLLSKYINHIYLNYITDPSGTTNRLKIDQHLLLTKAIFEHFLFFCCMPVASFGLMFCAMGCVCIYVKKFQLELAA